MQEKINAALCDRATQQAVLDDFTHTFMYMDVSEDKAKGLSSFIVTTLQQDNEPLDILEQAIYCELKETAVSTTDPTSLTDKINKMFTGRAQTIFNQITPHLNGTKGIVLDFGAGDGQITQLIRTAGYGVVGIDPRNYALSHLTAPVYQFDGIRSHFNDKVFETSIATNVLHHEAENERCLNELDRLTQRKLIIIETVPVGATPEDIDKDKLRSFMNDYFYNRLLHDPTFDVPVPGTYETPQGWIDRIEKYSWKTTVSIDLGVDQPIIQDTHHLLVFER